MAQAQVSSKALRAMKRLVDQLIALTAKERFSAHMPGHNYQPLIDLNWYQIDTTEIDGADNLFIGSGILGEAMRDLAAIYGAKQSRLTVGGSSVGLIASIMALSGPGDEIILARDAHKSVHHAVTLNKLRPIYVEPRVCQHGIARGYDVAQYLALIERHPHAKLVLLTTPTYYGYITALQPLAERLRQHGARLIVDEAHGAHLNFGPLKDSQALAMGGDIVIQSAHKTLPALTQTAFVHYHQRLAEDDIWQVDRYLEILQSSSPSYLLMASADLAVKTMHAKREYYAAHQIKLCHYIEEKLARYLVAERPQDQLKLFLLTAPFGYSGWQTAQYLKDNGIFCEMANGWGVLLYLSHLNQLSDIDAIATLLNQRADLAPFPAKAHQPFSRSYLENTENYIKVRCPLEAALGHYSAEVVVPYPPGVPLLAHGEKISEQLYQALCTLRDNNQKLIGPADLTLRTLYIYKES